MDSQHLREALILLNLNARMYPDSGAAHANFAAALRLSGERLAAIDSYRKALEHSPFNAEVRRKLRELEAAPAAANAAGPDGKRHDIDSL
jgi:tetratricopeptide (TPR) repeat protein